MPDEEGKLDLIWVRGAGGDDPNNPEGARVGVWDRHEQHPTPDHEIFVAGPWPVRVAATPAVNQKIADGAIERLDDSTAQKLLAKEQEKFDNMKADRLKAASASQMPLRTDDLAESVERILREKGFVGNTAETRELSSSDINDIAARVAAVMSAAPDPGANAAAPAGGKAPSGQA